jgi:hypothetical protein
MRVVRPTRGDGVKSLQNKRDRLEVNRRLDRLAPEAQLQWGSLTAAKMICHVGDALRMALGDLATRPQWGVLQWRHVDHHLRQFGA